MLSGRALKAAMEVVKRALANTLSDASTRAYTKILAATIQSDIHDIGKNIVVSMWTAAGFDVIDLGVDVPLKTIVDKAEEVGARIIALSALLTTSMPYMKDVVDQLTIRGLRSKYLVIVGGAPVTEEWARSIGADGTARNAADAVKLVRSLVTSD
jgi:methylmalonyl-CoA mutase cobalamin-binding domain/chain